MMREICTLACPICKSDLVGNPELYTCNFCKSSFIIQIVEIINKTITEIVKIEMPTLEKKTKQGERS